jgi:ribosomal protein S18 acetylase RimI-like enzyme
MEAARPAHPEELPRLAELARLAIAELVATKGGVMWHRREARPEPVEDSLAAALTDPDHLVLVGTIDGTVVGYAVARLEELRDGGVLGVLEDVYVEPEARAVGVGEALMDEVVAWCRFRDCVGVDSLVLPGNRESKNFFESFGMVARAIVVHRPLRTDSAAQ